jgi:hypothetical protein
MNEPATVYQVRSQGEILAVFSTYWDADAWAKEQADEWPGMFVLGHIVAADRLEDRRFTPSGFWKNGVWHGGEH